MLPEFSKDPMMEKELWSLLAEMQLNDVKFKHLEEIM